ncbi:MAG: ankyrin repeat domain-containing protein [Planctomycetota bacterium]|jgi:ankyrin repeat protein
MKTGLPFKLGIGVVLLFAVVIIACLLWTPLRVRWYLNKYNSKEITKRVKGAEGLIRMGPKGMVFLAAELKGGMEAARILQAFLDNREASVEFAFYQEYPIHIAASEGWKDVVEIMIECGADIEKGHSTTPFYAAVGNGHVEVVRLLLKHGADVNARDWGVDPYSATPLHMAAIHGNLDIAKLLLDNGAELNAKDGEDRTPLHWAVDGAYIEAVRLLLEYKTDIDSVDDKGRTPLYNAIAKEELTRTDIDILKLLLSSGADPSIAASADYDKRTPLHLAIGLQYTILVMMLIENGADPNIKNLEGETALHMAVENGNIEAARLLLENGAEVNVFYEIEFSDGEKFIDTPLDLAESEEMKALLRAHGGKTAEELEKEKK